MTDLLGSTVLFPIFRAKEARPASSDEADEPDDFDIVDKRQASKLFPSPITSEFSELLGSEQISQLIILFLSR
jgi:hypothetical protein